MNKTHKSIKPKKTKKTTKIKKTKKTKKTKKIEKTKKVNKLKYSKKRTSTNILINGGGNCPEGFKPEDETSNICVRNESQSLSNNLLFLADPLPKFTITNGHKIGETSNNNNPTTSSTEYMKILPSCNSKENEYFNNKTNQCLCTEGFIKQNGKCEEDFTDMCGPDKIKGNPDIGEDPNVCYCNEAAGYRRGNPAIIGEDFNVCYCNEDAGYENSNIPGECKEKMDELCPSPKIEHKTDNGKGVKCVCPPQNNNKYDYDEMCNKYPKLKVNPIKPVPSSAPLGVRFDEALYNFKNMFSGVKGFRGNRQVAPL